MDLVRAIDRTIKENGTQMMELRDRFWRQYVNLWYLGNKLVPPLKYTIEWAWMDHPNSIRYKVVGTLHRKRISPTTLGFYQNLVVKRFGGIMHALMKSSGR